MTDTVIDIVLNEYRGANSAKNVLAKLFRLSLFENGYNSSKYLRRLEHFANTLKKEWTGNIKSPTSIKGNLNKQFIRPSITWRIFQKGAMFHGTKESYLHIFMVKDGREVRLVLPLHKDFVKINNCKTILSKAMEHIRHELGYSFDDIISLIDVFIANPRNRISKDPKIRSSKRGNAIKELKRNKMTWNNFERTIQIIDPDHITFSMVLIKQNGGRDVHPIRISKPGMEYELPTLIEDGDEHTMPFEY